MFVLLNNSSALELSLISPDSIKINKEFQVEIILDSEETYDVKVFVHNSQDSGVSRDEYISQIFNKEKNTWQSSWNYLQSSFPNEKKYSLKVLESPGDRQVCARLRKTGANSSISKCNTITISQSESEPEIEDQNNDNSEVKKNNSKLNKNSEDESENNKNKEREEEKSIQSPSNKNSNNVNSNPASFEELSLSENKQPTYENKEIILKSDKNLNSDKIKNLENEIYITKKQKTTLSIFYIFNILLIFMIILMLLKKSIISDDYKNIEIPSNSVTL